MKVSLLAAVAAAAVALAGCHSESQTHLARGNVFQNQGKIAEAIAEYQKAAAADTSISAPWLRMGDLLYAQGKKDAAFAAYRQATARNPAQIEAWIGMARVQSEQGHDQAARDSLGRALDVRPRNLYARLSRAQLALQDGDAAAALADAKLAARLDDEDPTVLYVYGSAMAASKDYSGAKAAFDRIAKLAPASPLAAYGQARLDLAQGDRAGAVQALAALVGSAPSEKGPVAADPTFAALRGDPAFDRLVGGTPRPSASSAPAGIAAAPAAKGDGG